MANEGKLINDKTEMTYDPEKDTLTIANQAKDGSIYINTFYLKDKEKNKNNEQQDK